MKRITTIMNIFSDFIQSGE